MSTDWKDKYLEALEQQDLQRKRYTRKVALLSRGLAAVTPLGVGLDSRTDKLLLALKSLMRQENIKNTDLDIAVDALEKRLSAGMTDKQQATERIVKCLKAMIVGLRALPERKPPAELQAKLLKGLKQLDMSYQELAQLIDDMSEFQTRTLGSGKGGDERGFFARFLGQTKGSTAKVSEFSEVTPNGEVESVSNAEHQDPTSEATSPSDGQVSPSDRQVSPSDWRLEPTVRETLQRLLLKIKPPESVLIHYRAACELVERDLNGYELAPALEHLCEVLLASIDRDQDEFEAFLSQLNEKLQLAFTQLTTSQGLQQEDVSALGTLNESMRSRLSVFQTSVASASNIDSLKLDVARNMDDIVNILAVYHREGERRQTEMKRELSVLAEQMQEMEAARRVMAVQLEEQRLLAERDSLTRLPNREAYHRRSKEELMRWRRHGGKLSLAVCDLDLFKQVNDTYGHAVGDEVLQMTASLLKEGVRQTDFVARFGGEEFVVLLPEADSTQAIQVMEGMREAIGRVSFESEGVRFHVTMSVGISSFRAQDTIESVFTRADRALYDAKDAGRNCCRIIEAGGEVSHGGVL